LLVILYFHGIFVNNFQQILGQISHNVPAVSDVFASPIKETVGFQGLQKCSGEKPRKGRSPTAVFRSPSRLLAAKQIQSCYAQLGRTPFLLYHIISFIKFF
jgi:hypothetical protein